MLLFIIFQAIRAFNVSMGSTSCLLLFVFAGRNTAKQHIHINIAHTCIKHSLTRNAFIITLNIVKKFS